MSAESVDRLSRAVRALWRDDEGQALVEAVLFAPFVIFGIAAVIFFSQLGVLSERSESAVRYGNDVSYKSGGNAYSVASVYALLDEVQHPGNDELGPLCLQSQTAAPATASPAPMPSASPGAVPTIPGASAPPAGGSAGETQIQQDIAAALVNAETVGGNAGPSAKPFYKPVTVSVAGCQAGMLRLNPASSTGGSTGQAPAATANSGLPISTVGLSVSSTIAQPPALSLLIMGSPNLETSAHMTFLNVATPNTLVACMPATAVALTALDAGPLTQPQQQAITSFCPTGG